MFFLGIFKHKYASLGASLIFGAIALVLAWYLPIGREQFVVVSPDRTDGVIEVSPGTTISQSIVLPAGTYSGIGIFSTNERLVDTNISLTVQTEEGVEVSRSYDVSTVYAPEHNDALVLLFEIQDVVVKERDRYVIAIHTKGSAFSLVSSTGERDIYQQGALRLNGEETKQDLAVTTSARSLLSFGVRQGVVAGVIFCIALAALLTFTSGRVQWIGAALLLIGITPLAIAGYWFSDNVLGIADWDYYFSLHNAYREIVLTYNSFPFWNPWTCGGTAGLGDPEFSGFMPTFWLELAFGVERGIPLAIFLSTAVGAVGYLMLGKRVGLSVISASLVALIAMFGTVNLLEITEGHVNVFAAMWIPWIFWSWLGVYRQQLPPIICGIFLALTFYQGGIYLLMYTGLAFIMLLLLVPRRLDALKTTVIAGAWALGFASIKLFPVLMWLRQFPDDAYASSTYTLPYLTDIFFGRHLHGTYLIFKQDSGWHEYGAYIGYGALLLCVVGLTKLRKSRVVQALTLAVILSVLLSTLGPQLESIFDLLWFFPRSNISRFILFAVISIALLAGHGLDVLKKKVPRGQVLAIIVVGVVAVDLMSLTYQLSQQAFVLPDLYPAPEQAPAPIAFTPHRFDLAGEGSRTSRAYAAAKRGWGTFAYCSVLGPDPSVRTVFDENHGPFILNTSNAAANVTHWSPNEVHVTVDAQESFEGSLNTNSAEGWVVNGTKAAIVDGRVGVKLPAGQHELVFKYEAPGFRVGVFVFVVTLGLATLLYWPRRREL